MYEKFGQRYPCSTAKQCQLKSAAALRTEAISTSIVGEDNHGRGNPRSTKRTNSPISTCGPPLQIPAPAVQGQAPAQCRRSVEQSHY